MKQEELKKAIETMFEEENEHYELGYKTGLFTYMFSENAWHIAQEHDCDCIGAGQICIDWFVTRGSVRKPVIRVKWHFPKYATRKVYWNGYYTYKKTWQCSTKEERFEFSPFGLRLAMARAKGLAAF